MTGEERGADAGRALPKLIQFAFLSAYFFLERAKSCLVG